ncbi:hypothetical protein CANINC_001906 [Pichia inconspicua]|uniref:DUF3020 domain-containing protein n=1 Tax=Pichia inconspicua TaxID=52247 RepID=A0A4T0X2H6_9ASCO|nr:hypothetical protein CANINC_001906 [[Candida] inconspicua]
MSLNQHGTSSPNKHNTSPEYHEVSIDENLKSIDQNNALLESKNNGETGASRHKIGDEIVQDLANSVVASLYFESNEGTKEGTSKESSSSPSQENLETTRLDGEDDDYDFELNTENMMGNIIANAMENLLKPKEIEDSSPTAKEKEQFSSNNNGNTTFSAGLDRRKEAFNTEVHKTDTSQTLNERIDGTNINQMQPMKEDELDDVIANAFKDQFHLKADSENSVRDIESDRQVSHSGGQHNYNDDEDVSLDRNSDLMTAINDALVQNMSNTQESLQKEATEIKVVEEELELNAAIADALKKTEAVLENKDYEADNDEETHLNNEDLEDVIQDIDMNDVLKTALRGNEIEKEIDYDANQELNAAIKEALMTVPKKPIGHIPAKKPDNKVSFSADKVDLSTELTSVISNALKESGLVNRDNANEFDIEAALKEVVSGVIEHNLVSHPQQRVEKTTDKETDYNWDAIMDNAFEMAMQYPEDLHFDVDEHSHVNDSFKRQTLNLSSNKSNQGKITKKPSNRQHVPQPKPAVSLTKDLKSRFPLSVVSNKVSAVATVTTVLDLLHLNELDVNDVFRLKTSKLDSIKRNVSSVLSSLINSTPANPRDQIPKDQLDEKEKLRLENRERKKRWREFNIERNRDLDLKTRVIKRANHLYPLPEHASLKKEWIETEFKKRKQKRLEREQKRNFNMIDIKSFDAKDVYSFDKFFKNKANLFKIVEIYNEMGGMVTEDKLLSSSADRTASVTCIATVLAASYLVEKEKQQLININHENDEDDEYSIIQSLVVSVDKYLKNKDHIRRVDELPDESKVDSWDIISDENGLERKSLGSSISLKPMKIAPVTGSATFKINLDGIKLVNPPSILQNQMNSINVLPSGKMTSKLKHDGIMNSFGTSRKKYNVSRNKKKSKPLVINFEKFLVPNPPKPEVTFKRKGSFATQIINNMEPSLKKRLADERDVLNIIDNNNDFDIEYDINNIDISNGIDHEFDNYNNDAAKANLKLIEKQLNLQVRQMQSESDSDEKNENVDDDALASVVNQVVGALENDYMDTLDEPKLFDSNSVTNSKNEEIANVHSVNESVGQKLSEQGTDTLNDMFEKNITNKTGSVETDIQKSDVKVKNDILNHTSDNSGELEIPSRSGNSVTFEKHEMQNRSLKNDTAFDSSAKLRETKKRYKLKPANQIPKIPLPQYGTPKPMSRVTKVPIMKPIEKLSSVSSKASNVVDVKTGGIKRPGAFRKPTAFRRPGDTRNSNIRPFGGIPLIKKL